MVGLSFVVSCLFFITLIECKFNERSSQKFSDITETELHTDLKVLLIGATDTFNTCCSIFLLNAVAPRVGIIMGSDSDLPVMKDAARILNMFGVSSEVAFL